MKRADPISLCPNVFHKVEKALMYMELHQTVRTQKGFRIQFYIRNETLRLFCYGISGPSKYGCLNFWTVQTVSSLWRGWYVSTHEILFRQFIIEILICLYFKKFHRPSNAFERNDPIVWPNFKFSNFEFQIKSL